MPVWPLKFREAPGGRLLFADDSGAFFQSSASFLDRYAQGQLLPEDERFLLDNGQAFGTEGDLAHTAFAYRWSRRQAAAGPLAYVILVPTLRCNLACVYCQVSRAAENARGHDWTEQTLQDVLTFLDGLPGDQVKIEFQGGEPLLRVDLLERVRTFCRQRFTTASFVVCTNLQRLGPREWAFLEDPDTFVSTSIDGDPATHTRQRTQSSERTDAFFANLRTAVERLGSERISALPTIDPERPPDLEALVDLYEAHGIRSIYLRPISYHGFARKITDGHTSFARWSSLYDGFIDQLIARNARTGRVIEEYYFSLCLKRVFQAGADGHVDLRNPNLLGADYLVIDHDGTLYPSDEARMLARIGQIDLSLGQVGSGIDQDKLAVLNANSCNNFDPDCIHCPYQPFCGTDRIDDLARYGRIDLPRHATWFCQRHLGVFDKIFALLYRQDEAVRFSLAHWLGVPSLPADLTPVHA